MQTNTSKLTTVPCGETRKDDPSANTVTLTSTRELIVTEGVDYKEGTGPHPSLVAVEWVLLGPGRE